MRESLPGMSYTKAQGTYLAWVDVGGLMDKIDAQGKSDATQSGEDPKRPVDIVEEWLVHNAGIQLNPGRNYGPGGETFMRMNLGAPRPLIKAALDNIAEAVDKA